jgi:hypothetical protein
VRQEAELAQQRALEEQERAREQAEAETREKAERRLTALNPEQRLALEEKVRTQMNTEVRWLAEYGKSSTIYQDMLRNYMLRELMRPMDSLVDPKLPDVPPTR